LSGPALQEFLRAVLARGVPLRFKARGFSMSPFIHDGDVLTVAPQAEPRLRSGEVVAFCHQKTGKLVVHRVLARMTEGLLLRGDNTSESDGLIPSENVLGLVTKVERNGYQVRLGRGMERFFIAFLSRHDLLQPLIAMARQVMRPLVRKILA
jgi:signal peptidase I